MATLLSQIFYFACLAFSLFVNLLFIFKLVDVDGGEWNWKLISWSRRAAEEAEYVATIPCSGHGRAYLDGLILENENQPACECNSCYGGPDCSQFSTGCAANADSGDPFFLEPFWMQHAAQSAVTVSGWNRMSYAYNDQSCTSAELEKHIRQVHAVVGNAVTDGKHIVFGAGSTQLLTAALHALASDNNSSSPASVLVSIPYYKLYQTQAEFFPSLDYKFVGDAALFKNVSDASTNVIEFVTSPNNPDGQVKKAVFRGPKAKAIYDRVYHWPHFTAIPAPADDDLMIFSISKLTGHAGTRLGWAVVKDESVYQKMSEYIRLSSFGVSRDAQLRALKLLKVVLAEGGKEIFEFGYHTLKTRWEKLSNTFSMSSRFSLQEIAPQHCTYFKQIRGPSPAYAWVKCEWEEDEDCYAVLENEGNVYGRRGSAFGAGDRHVRLSLLRSQDDFDILVHRLSQLVVEEKYNAKSMKLMMKNDHLFVN